MPHNPETLARDLVALLGPDMVRGPDAVAMMDPGFDALNLAAGVAVLPGCTADVQKLLAYCHARGIAVVAQGGRTGLAGGAQSARGQVVVSMARMNRVLAIDPASALATVEAGVTLAALDAAVAPHGLMPGIDLGARDSATIGGMISTNAGGIEAFRQGVMRSRVSGLEAVLADGTVLCDLSRVAKSNEGHDVKQLFIGAEGTLGIVTRAVLRLVPRPMAKATALVRARDFASALAAFRLFPQQQLLAFELMNARYLPLAGRDHGITLAEADGHGFVVETEGSTEPEAQARLEAPLTEALEQELVQDVFMASNSSQARQFWLLREDSWTVDRAHPGGLWFDITVPLAELDHYVQRLEAALQKVVPDAQLYIVGHLGDGNLHLTIAGPKPMTEHKQAVADCVHDGLKAMGGSFSAEHGIGTEKRAALHALSDPGKLAAMRAIKQALDPKGIMNPGKVL